MDSGLVIKYIDTSMKKWSVVQYKWTEQSLSSGRLVESDWITRNLSQNSVSSLCLWIVCVRRWLCELVQHCNLYYCTV